jgi:YD repeat-containing protein
MGTKGIFICGILFCIMKSNAGFSQNMLPWKSDIINHKISAVIVTDNIVLNEKSKKKYTDTVKYDIYGNLTEKHITAYDTDSKRDYAGVWTYTYDSVGNRKLETRVTPEHHVMDYFNYLYDSNRIKKQIWVYWDNMRHIFDRIYEVKYDGSGRLRLEMMEDGSEKLDSVFSFNYDSTNRLNKIICGADKDFKDTINTVDYVYNSYGGLAETITSAKGSKSIEEFAYDENRRVVKHTTDAGTTTYLYDKNGLLATSEVTVKDKKGLKYKYTYTYIFR